MAVAKALMFTSMPLMAMEIVTSTVSFVTGELRMPTAVDVGSATDLAILFTWLATVVARAVKAEPRQSGMRDEVGQR